MAVIKEPLTSEEFNKTMHDLAGGLVLSGSGIEQALERNTRALLDLAMINGQIATGHINPTTTVEQLEKLIDDNMRRSY